MASGTSPGQPKFVNITLQPGDSRRVDAFDAGGHPVVYRIIAEECPAPPGEGEEPVKHKPTSTVRAKMQKQE